MQAPELARELGPGAGHEGGRFFMPNLNEADLVLMLAQSFDDAVDAIAGYSEDGIDAPVEQSFNQNVTCGLSHFNFSRVLVCLRNTYSR